VTDFLAAVGEFDHLAITSGGSLDLGVCGCRFGKSRPSAPVGRVGEPEDLAETYLYLMRERFSTGAMIVVDGEALWSKKQNG